MIPCWRWRIDASVSGKTKKRKTKTLPESIQKQGKLYLKQVKWSHPGSRQVFLFLLQTKSITEHHFGTSLGCLCAHQRNAFTYSAQPGFPERPEAAAALCRPPPPGHRLQASFKWQQLLTPRTYSPALLSPIFITSIILDNKYSNPGSKSRA